MASRSDSITVDGVEIAVRIDEGAVPTLVWLSGFRSDMAGSKAEALADFGRRSGRRVVRFDYSGHGASGGRFADGTIGRWADEAMAVVDRFADGPMVLVGSSMGGWIALLLALRLQAAGRGDRLKGLVLIAPAPDFTGRLMEPSFTDAMRIDLAEHGRTEIPSAYSPEPTVITAALIEDGRRHAILDTDIRIGAPVHILQGMRDPDVPHAHAMLLVDRLVHDDVVLTLIKDGDHRLSRPEDVDRILSAVGAMAG
ncbi:alpha/beta hydrolase [Chthonobacter rhizosphaerae]|uniref:alpha/beta hydrolase n=1 Tax=Chthonobacter rhizosphaerae TaxID=2735553 RepID=UPI0015EFCD71|nr:alpha/beta hydrolase [Chthonobacter rhizosphaerae]